MDNQWNPHIEMQKRVSVIIDRDFNLLFSRLYYFLVATAFLIGALATLFTVKDFNPYNPDSKMVIFAHFVCGAGYYLSLFFTWINYLNMHVVQEYGNLLDKMERGEMLLNTTKELVDKAFKHLDLSLPKFINDLVVMVRNPSGKNERLAAPNTWIIPLGFVLFWALVWGVVLPTDAKYIGDLLIIKNIKWWPQTTFIVGFPMFYLIIIKGLFLLVLSQFWIWRFKYWLVRQKFWRWLGCILFLLLLFVALVILLTIPQWVGDIRDIINGWFK